MNISHAGMAQPSFKGWVFDGKTAINDRAVTMITCSSPSSYATMHLYGGQQVNVRANANQVIDMLNKSNEKGVHKVPEYTFMA